MSSIRVKCPVCAAVILHIDSDSIGTEVECPECSEKFLLKPPVEKATSRSGPAEKSRSKRRRDEDDDYEPDHPPMARLESPGDNAGKSFATVGLLSGFLGLSTCCCPITGLVFGIFAMAFGFMSYRRSGSSAMATIAIVLGVVVVLITISWFLFVIFTDHPVNPEPVNPAPINPAPGKPAPANPSPIKFAQKTIIIQRVFTPRIPFLRR